MRSDPEQRADRVARLAALPYDESAALSIVVGEAVLDLWIYGESWSDIVERCLEAAEDERSVTRTLALH